MAEPKNPKMRLQWQDGVGNMLVLEEEENQDKKTVRLADVDVGWAFAVAGLVVIIIFALCMMARCRLSMFTRRRKKIMKAKKKSIADKEKKDKAAKPSEVKKVMAISATSKEQEKVKKLTKKDFIIDMIDSALDPCSGEDTEDINCSLESIDRAGEEQMLRRASGVSVTLSLVFDKESDRPVFVKQKV